MYPTSAGWLPALTAPVVRLVMWGEVWTGIGGSLVAQFRLAPESGSIVVDASNAQRWSVSAFRAPVATTLYPDGLPVPLTAADTLFPDGVELVIWKGVAYAGGPQLLPFNFGMGEAVPCGRYLLEDVEVFDSMMTPGEFYFQMAAADRAATLDRAGFTAPYSTNPLATLDVTVTNLVRSLSIAGIANLPLRLIPDPVFGFPVPAQATYTLGSAPFSSAILSLCSGVGFEAFFDRLGTLVVQPVPDPSTVKPIGLISEGNGGLLIGLQSGLDNTRVPNVIYAVAQGSNVGAPLQGVWWDSNPLSPTFYGVNPPPVLPTGSYPTTVVSISSTLAKTQADINRVANSAGLASLGSLQSLQVRMIENAAYDVEDVTLVTRSRAGLEDTPISIMRMTLALGITTPMLVVGRGVY